MHEFTTHWAHYILEIACLGCPVVTTYSGSRACWYLVTLTTWEAHGGLKGTSIVVSSYNSNFPVHVSTTAGHTDIS